MSSRVFEKFSGATKQPKQPQFWGFWGRHGPGYMGLVATTWAPMRAQVPILSPNDHPSPSKGRQKGFGKCRILKFFQVPLNSLTRANQHENSKVLAGKGPWGGGGGGGDRGYPEFGPRTPATG